MGFILSRIYKERQHRVLVLKPSRAKKHSIVDEFLAIMLSEYTVCYKYMSEYIMYHTIAVNNSKLMILEMHDYMSSDYFWDCVQGMDSVIYFMQDVSEKTIKSLIDNIRRIKDANTDASILLVALSVQGSMHIYTAFKKQVKHTLEGRRYKIVDGVTHKQAEEYTADKSAICSEIQWLVWE